MIEPIFPLDIHFFIYPVPYFDTPYISLSFSFFSYGVGCLSWGPFNFNLPCFWDGLLIVLVSIVLPLGPTFLVDLPVILLPFVHPLGHDPPGRLWELGIYPAHL